MAVEALFNTDMATLKSKLRLSGAANADAQAIIDQKVQEVRVGFYDALGATRVATLLETSLDDNPTDADGIMRLKAANTEVIWVRMLLLRALPSLFMDASGNTLQAWNEEALSRETGASLESELNRLQTEVLDALEDLKGDESVDPGKITATSIGPDCTPMRPGDTIRPEYARRSSVKDIFPAGASSIQSALI